MNIWKMEFVKSAAIKLEIVVNALKTQALTSTGLVNLV